MRGALTATLFALCLGPLQAIPSTVFSNDVYPETHLDPSGADWHQQTPTKPTFSKMATLNMSMEVDLKRFIMNYLEDVRICFSESLKELIIGKDDSDRQANVWWGKHCGRRTLLRVPSRSLPESTLIRYRRKSSNRGSSQQSLAIKPADQKKLNKLLKNKKVQCNPKKAVVELPNDDPSQVILKPSCVYIKQCGGCCGSPHLECVSTKNKTRKFKVLALVQQLSKPGSLTFDNEQTLKTVSVQEHKSCQCQCKERSEHCTSKQEYDADACRCQCPASSIKTCPLGKVWDENQCDCKCSDISECTTGRYFDRDSCRCADPPK